MDKTARRGRAGALGRPNQPSAAGAQSDLASKSGVSLSTLSAIESGSPTVQMGFYLGVLSALDVLDGLDKVAVLADDPALVHRLSEDLLPKRVRR